MKPEPDEIWKNIHTNIRTRIIGRIFFSILHVENTDGNKRYYNTHYKTFQKHWMKIQ